MWISRKSIHLCNYCYKTTRVKKGRNATSENPEIHSMQNALCTQGNSLLKVLYRNPGRTCWQVGKPLLDIIDVDSSSKVGKRRKHTRGELLQTRKTYNTLSSHHTRWGEEQSREQARENDTPTMTGTSVHVPSPPLPKQLLHFISLECEALDAQRR